MYIIYFPERKKFSATDLLLIDKIPAPPAKSMKNSI